MSLLVYQLNRDISNLPSVFWQTSVATTEERAAALTGMITSARTNTNGHIHFNFDVTPRFKTYHNNNNNDNDNDNDKDNDNDDGLLTDPLGGSSLLKYINYN